MHAQKAVLKRCEADSTLKQTPANAKAERATREGFNKWRYGAFYEDLEAPIRSTREPKEQKEVNQQRENSLKKSMR